MSASDPFQAFLSAPWPTAPADEAPDEEETFLANEAALPTGEPGEHGPGIQTAVLRAFGLDSPDTEAGA